MTTTTTDTLHPRIAELLTALDDSRAELRAFVGSLSAEQLAAPARGDEWSIAQVLEHLALTEDGMGRLFSKLVHDVEATGAREADTSSVLGRNDAWGVITANVKVKAPERVCPTGSLSPDESMARLEASREKLKEVMARSSGLALGTASFPHPLFGAFDGYQWGLIVSQHELRHIRQMRRIVGGSES